MIKCGSSSICSAGGLTFLHECVLSSNTFHLWYLRFIFGCCQLLFCAKAFPFSFKLFFFQVWVKSFVSLSAISAQDLIVYPICQGSLCYLCSGCTNLKSYQRERGRREEGFKNLKFWLRRRKAVSRTTSTHYLCSHFHQRRYL